MSAIHPDDRKRMAWIERRLGQLGIEVRQSKAHLQMRYYLELLRKEIAMTERFLREDGHPPPNTNMKDDGSLPDPDYTGR